MRTKLIVRYFRLGVAKSWKPFPFTFYKGWFKVYS